METLSASYICTSQRQLSTASFFPILVGTADMVPAFPNLSNLASILMALPVTTATVERTFSTMKLVKTILRSRMGEDTLDLRICVEGPDSLSADTLDAVVDHYKSSKKRRLPLLFGCFYFVNTFIIHALCSLCMHKNINSFPPKLEV